MSNMPQPLLKSVSNANIDNLSIVKALEKSINFYNLMSISHQMPIPKVSKPIVSETQSLVMI